MKELISEYANAYQYIIKAINDLTDEELKFKPDNNSWNIKEVIIHLADSELVVVYRMKKIIAEENPLLNLMHQDLWTSNLNYNLLDHRPFLNLFKAIRETMVLQLRTINIEVFNRTGSHETLGEISLKELVIRYIGHVEEHIKQIERLKQAYKDQKNIL
jgi:DinB superfamily